jgi:uncharacterized protein (DUF1697 family)
MPKTAKRPTRYIAFLRAINVGGHNVKMNDLRRLFEALSFENVDTFIASGNVIFDAPAQDVRSLEEKIERQLRKALGYEVTTFIRTAAELATLATYEPFDARDLEGDGNSLYVAFLREAPAANAAQKLLALRTGVNDFHVQDREAYWLCRTARMSESGLSGPFMEKALGMPATLRNVTTINKLAAKYCSDLP